MVFVVPFHIGGFTVKACYQKNDPASRFLAGFNRSTARRQFQKTDFNRLSTPFSILGSHFGGGAD